MGLKVFLQVGNRERTTMRRRKIVEDVKLVAGSNNFLQRNREKHIAGDFGLESLKI